MLQKAKQNAKKQQVKVNFQKHDARKLLFTSSFDIVLMLCEGAFPLMETDEMNYHILNNASNALKTKNSKSIFTILNGLFPLYHPVKDFLNSEKRKKL